MLKKLFLIMFAAALTLPALSFTGCSDSPEARHVEPPVENRRDVTDRPPEDVTQAGIIRD